MLYLILLTLWFHKIFKLIFLKHTSWPKTIHAEHWRKPACIAFQGNSAILLAQQFCGAVLNMLLCFQSKTSFNQLILTFYFDLVPSFYFQKWNRFILNFYASPQWVMSLLNYLLPWKVCANLQIKRFSLMKFWYIIWMYGGSEF